MANRCTECRKEFLTQVGLKNHMESAHVPESVKMFKCETCSKAFTKQHFLVRHKKMYHTKHEDKKFECYKCSKRYVNITVNPSVSNQILIL